MRKVLEQFREWHANRFGDFAPDVNAELLTLDNAAAAALEAPLPEELHTTWNNAMERAAEICEASGRELDNEWNRKLGAASDLKETCDECAASIRASKLPLPSPSLLSPQLQTEKP